MLSTYLKKRQEELEILLNKIAVYKPTKILVEWDRIKKIVLPINVIKNFSTELLALTIKAMRYIKLASSLQKMGHQRIFCSDATAEWFGVELDWDNYDVVAYLKSKRQYEKSTRYDFQSFYEWSDSLKTLQTLTEHLAMLNSPKTDEKTIKHI